MEAVKERMSFFDYLVKVNGYRDPRDLGDGRYACICQFAFTHAILTGRIGDTMSYDDRWCYKGYAKAKAALDAWDGKGEPTGWHRHPDTGRRVDEDGREYVYR